MRELHKINTTPSESARQGWGISHEALYTRYKGAILPLRLYGAPVWIDSLAKNATKQYTTDYSTS